MKIRLTLLVFCFLSLGSLVFGQDKPGDSLSLSPKGRAAFEILFTAKRFEDTYIGYDGELSKLVAAYRDLLDEPGRVGALKSLVEKASKAGQLYGLAGLFDADYQYFLAVLGQFKKDYSEVDTISGCLGGKRVVSDIVYRKDRNTIRLENPYQSFDEWKKKAKVENGFMIDIAGGGYSFMFRGHDLQRQN